MTVETVLAIDLGTSGPKVAIVTTGGEVIAADFEPVPLIIEPGGGAEQDPEKWWDAVGAATRRVVAAAPREAEALVAVSCTGQWSGTVPIDSGGDALGNAIIWMDTRGASAIADLIGGPVRIQGYSPPKLRTWIRLTGGAPGRSGKDSLAHILWMRDAMPDMYRRTATFLEPKDYLNLRLTGRVAATYDSIALHWLTDNRDPARVQYHPELLTMAGLHRSRLPDLIPATAIVGGVLPGVADDFGIPRGIPVIGGTPDVQSAAIGSGAVADFAGHLYIGTSSWISAHVPSKKTDILHNMASLPAPIPGRYFIADEQETAGACLDYLASMLAPAGSDASRAEHYRALDRMAAEAPSGAGGLLFTPWLYGERTPVEDHTVRAGFFNMSIDTTREHLARAVFEGVALNARWLLGYVEKFCGRRMEPLTIVGGGAKSEVWCGIFADVLGRTVRQASDPIWVNARGAAFLAAVALRRLRIEDIPARVAIEAEHRPNAGVRSLHDRRFKEFVNLYRANRRIYARLNS